MIKRFLAAALILSLSPLHAAHALSCVPPSLDRALENADTIFEGRVLKIERHFTDPRLESGFETGSGTHFEKATVRVTRPIKGDVTAQQHVTVILHEWMPAAPDAADWLETENERREGLFIFDPPPENIRALATADAPVFFVGMCGGLTWDPVPENIAHAERAAR